MACNCNNNPLVHRVSAITVGTDTVDLTVTNPTDVGNLDTFIFIRCQAVTGITGNPLPVTITINGETIPLVNRFSKQITSDHLPKRACGVYIAADSYVQDADTTVTLPARVVLVSTPRCKCNA